MTEAEFRDQTAIVGIGYSRGPGMPGGFSKQSGVDVLTLAVRAARQACADAGIDPRDIDGAAMYQIGDDSVNVRTLVSALGCRANNYVSMLVGGGPLASLSVVQAAEAVHHGICDYVVVFRAMNGRSGVRMGEWGAGWGGGASRARGDSQFSQIYGLAGAPSDSGFQARRYMHLAGVTSLDFAELSVACRQHAIANPRAIMRKPITIEDHQQSPMIADPYRLFDCCLESDVGCALIVTSAERARDLRRKPVLISAGMAGSRRSTELADTALRDIGPRLLRAAGVGLSDVDLFEAYDNFTDMPMRMLEDIGFCERGEAKELVKHGGIGLDGDVPLNTHGGLKNEGYCHGFNNILEAVQQLRGEAEDMCPDWANGNHTFDRSICRQVRNAEVALNASVNGASALVLRGG